MDLQTAQPPLVLVTVGTDHHPFDRLMDWIDAWLADTTRVVRCVAQYGTSRPPRHANGVPKLAYADLQRLVAEAHVIVSHAGPGAIMDSRQAGLKPIVVARRHDLGEHVDNHQVAFGRRFAELRLINLAADEAGLRGHIESSLDEPRPVLASGREANAQTVARFAELVAELGVRRPRGWRVLHG